MDWGVRTNDDNNAHPQNEVGRLNVKWGEKPKEEMKAPVAVGRLRPDAWKEAPAVVPPPISKRKELWVQPQRVGGEAQEYSTSLRRSTVPETFQDTDVHGLGFIPGPQEKHEAHEKENKDSTHFPAKDSCPVEESRSPSAADISSK